MSLEKLNQLSPADLEAEFLKCCSSTKWAQAMVKRAPFAQVEELLEHADQCWAVCREEDWLEAIQSHPRIGTAKKVGAWSKQEQAGMATAEDETKRRMAQLNHEYFEKFGFTFLICATGKSADEMLQALEQRIQLSRTDELKNAAEQLGMINKIRLEKLL